MQHMEQISISPMLYSIIALQIGKLRDGGNVSVVLLTLCQNIQIVQNVKR
jgi:hypothetical protein